MENSYAQELLMWSDIIIKYSEKVLEMGQILDNLYRKNKMENH